MFRDLILPPRSEPEEARGLLHELARRGCVIGTDEAGRGALAGPVAAASVYLTPEQEERLTALKLRDSKKITALGREKLFSAMNEMGVMWRVFFGDVGRIDRDNVLQASLWTMGRSVELLTQCLPSKPACVIVDGTERIPGLDVPQWTLIRADNLIPSVSAASVVAKVMRDRLMLKMSERYPGYGLERNKGYPTRQHMEAVRVMGMTEIHRRTFCRKILHGREK